RDTKVAGAVILNDSLDIDDDDFETPEHQITTPPNKRVDLAIKNKNNNSTYYLDEHGKMVLADGGKQAMVKVDSDNTHKVALEVGKLDTSKTFKTIFCHVKVLFSDGTINVYVASLPAPYTNVVPELREIPIVEYPRPAGADPYTTWNKIKGDPFILSSDSR